MRQFVLIGGGHASATAARSLRRLGFDGRIVLVCDEAHAPYQRPPLSKEHLSDDKPDMEDIWSVSAEWCAENDVALRTGVAASHIDVATRAVTLADGTILPADAVLIATGVRPRAMPSIVSPRVYALKTIEDAAAVRAAMRPGTRIAIVGGGFIGLEVAAAARARGTDVALFEAASVPLGHILGDRIGAIVADLHRERGVELHTGITVSTIEDTDTGVRIVASDGSVTNADIVVVGIGTIPNDEIARASEITVGNGIRVDQYCRTSAPGIYAAGDVANHYHPLIEGRTRVEHFDNAARQAMVAARNMMGERTEYQDVHWFWSDQYDVNLQFAGHTAGSDRIVTRGSLEDRDFSAFYLKGEQVVAVFGMDRGSDVMMGKTLIAERRSLGDAVLSDDDIDLQDAILDQSAVIDDQGDADGDDEEGFERVARSGQIGEGIVRRFVAGDTELAVARSKGQIYALHNVCTHLACKLAAGKIEGDGLTCLCHGSIFELATGIPINPPATLPVKTFPTLERDGQIFVKLR